MTAAIAEVPRKKSDVETRHAASPPALYAPSQSTVYEIPVDLIVRSETNRQPELDDDFVESISRGVDTPVLVRPIKATFEQFAKQPVSLTGSFGIGDTIYKLVYGERRWAASKKAGKKTIPAIVRELTDTQALEIQVRENEQRQDYNALDRAAAYVHLRAQYMLDHKNEKGFTEEKCCALIAEACKNDKIKGRTVQQIIALQGKLSQDCKEGLRKGEMEQSHAYEFSRLSVGDQAELLLWLRQQTHHSQGDIPSVRRLKLEIHKMDELREAEKSRQPLFAPPQPGTATTKVPTIEDAVFQGALKLVREVGERVGWVSNPLLQRRLNVGYTLAAALLARMEKEEIVGPIFGDDGRRNYIRADSKPAAQTSAAKEPDWIDRKAPVQQSAPKPPSKSFLKAEAESRQKLAEAQLKHQRNIRIEKKYRVALFSGLASKSHVCSRMLTHVVPGLLLELWEGNDIPLEDFAQPLLGWPAPRNSSAYAYTEIQAHLKKHTRKFSGNLLSALLITQHMAPPDAERMAKYFGVDVKKLRQKAATAVKQEDAKAPAGKKGAKA